MSAVNRIFGWTALLAMGALLGMSSSALADGGTRWAFPAIPTVRHVDSESSVCVPITNSVPSQTEFSFDLSFDATASNNVAVAIGEDKNGDGDLSFSETDVVVGWDCGRYFLDRPKAGRRYESTRYDEPKARKLSYLCRMAGLGGGIETFRIAVDEGEFGPDGVVAEGAGGLWADELTDSDDRHRIRWEISRDSHVSFSAVDNATINSVVFSGGLISVSPSSVVSGGRVAANIFGADAKYVLYSSGAVTASATRNSFSVSSDFSRFASGYAGMYIDVVGSGDLSFSHGSTGYHLTTRVYVDDELATSYNYTSAGQRTVHVGSGAGVSTWCWKPGWNMLRVTRRGRFRDTGPSGGFTIRQRGGIIQLH